MRDHINAVSKLFEAETPSEDYNARHAPELEDYRTHEAQAFEKLVGCVATATKDVGTGKKFSELRHAPHRTTEPLFRARAELEKAIRAIDIIIDCNQGRGMSSLDF